MNFFLFCFHRSSIFFYIRASQIPQLQMNSSLSYPFEAGRYHSSCFISGEHRHRQNKPKAILSPLSRGPAWDTNSFSRVLTIITALHCAKHSFQQLVTPTASVNQASEYQRWCTCNLSGGHLQSLAKNNINPFARTGTECVSWKLLSFPSSLQQHLTSAMEKSSCPIDNITLHHTAQLVPRAGGRQSRECKAPVKSTLASINWDGRSKYYRPLTLICSLPGSTSFPSSAGLQHWRCHLFLPKKQS